MRYQIVLEKPAQKFLKRLNRTDKERVLRAIYKLPEGENIKRLKGHQDLLRLRVGDYRVIYTVNNGKLVVCVVDIGNRGDVYKRY
ncbi:type II toxin-antitoxin system RelE/ParE family toxin [[Ruminococcus] gnavus]|uniref:Type II toxin-antitoxin system RelE/ParE family toxin n=1 Tax=Mediterraneibacter gnavus TaxID=33038 RepID=A0AAW6JW24_MEDGN|nr:type II toxin-antitoxin system RelE/ParE family toxin [Mediterraneibacter gnavus]MDC6138773.1 type II toxin-antitoxin system RelE/ParE family toxin [Mediterraneibacter gnavus]MDE1202339.1 type II toxin-antitoxin system RelE/ParE family toxin [Mediterraneibacter gnavus]